MEEEIWKDVVGYEGYYQVSNQGRIRSSEKRDKHKPHSGKVLKTVKTKRYDVITLCINGAEKQHLVHRLVAEAFLPNPENKPCVDHIDTDIRNNKVDNLRWVTNRENSNNNLTRKHISDGKKGKHRPKYVMKEDRKKNIALAKSRPIKCCDLQGNEVARFYLVKEAALFANVSTFAIYHNLQGKTKTAGGFCWSLI